MTVKTLHLGRNMKLILHKTYHVNASRLVRIKSFIWMDTGGQHYCVRIYILQRGYFYFCIPVVGEDQVVNSWRTQSRVLQLVKAKLSLCVPWRHIEELEVWLHLLLTLAWGITVENSSGHAPIIITQVTPRSSDLSSGERQDSRFGPIYPSRIF
jgi:hypothetical protein